MFRLLKEAQIVSKLDQSELKVLESARAALGKASIADLVESFSPSNEDYVEWLRVIAEEGAARGVTLTRKGDFVDLAFEVLENDPMAPPYEMQEMIVNKLWNDYKAARHGARIEKVARAQEEEEALRAADEFANSEAEDDVDAITPDQVDLQLSDDTADEFADEFAADTADEFADEFSGYDDGDSIDADDVPPGAEVEFDDASSADLPDDGSDEVALSDDDIEAIAARIVDQLRSDEDAIGASPRVVSTPPVEQQVVSKPDVAKEEEEKGKPKKTNLHQMLSGPRSTITQAQKEIEADGENAWKAHQLPSNPHPKKSMAYAAWERGMKRAVRTHYGLDDKPTFQPKKKK